MAFEFDKDLNKADSQLTFADYQLAQAEDRVAKVDSTGSSAFDYDTWMLAHREPEESKTSRFVTLSAIIHAGAIAAITMLSVPLVEQIKTETITIELEEPVNPVVRAKGTNVPATQGGVPIDVSTPAVEELKDVGGADDIVVAKPLPTEKAPVKAQTKSVAPKAEAPKSVVPLKSESVAKSSGMAARTPIQAVPVAASLDDIEAPELNTGAIANTPVASDLDEDFSDDFEKIDSKHSQALMNEKAQLDSMAASLASEQDEQLNALDEAQKEEAAQLAALQNNIRRKNEQAIASALAAEKAAALKAAQAAALEEEKNKKSGIGGSGDGTGMGMGAGAGNNGSSEEGSQLAGIPSGVRSLEQLRQMPGNPRPQYDRQERLLRHQGSVAFLAYINKQGYVSKFRMLKSTGYKNLDGKTLAALKKWRFYPGQEGWVELPFQWDLKGGVQEAGGRLRVSRN